MTLEDAIEQTLVNDVSMDHLQLAEWLSELKLYRDSFKTADGFYMNPGDNVFVYESSGIHETEVKEPMTGYMLFNNIPLI